MCEYVCKEEWGAQSHLHQQGVLEHPLNRHTQQVTQRELLTRLLHARLKDLDQINSVLQVFGLEKWRREVAVGFNKG